MKKLVLILLLLPLFSFSQTLINKVERMSYLDSPNNIHKSTEVFTNMSIFVDNGFLYIKDDVETLKYKILKVHYVDDNGKKISVYEVLVKKDRYLASVSTYQGSKALLLESIKNTDISFFYERRG